MIMLFVTDISPLASEELYLSFYDASSWERRNRADELKTHQDKVRCVAAGMLLKYAYKKFKTISEKRSDGPFFGNDTTEPLQVTVFELLSATDTDLPQIQMGKRGKPYFSKEEPFFNLSHSGNYVICGIGSEELGVDVQEPGRQKESVLQRVFTSEERETLLQGESFERAWAEKEAAAKLSGEGIGVMLSKDKNAETVLRVKLCSGELEGGYGWAMATWRKCE